MYLHLLSFHQLCFHAMFLLPAPDNLGSLGGRKSSHFPSIYISHLHTFTGGSLLCIFRLWKIHLRQAMFFLYCFSSCLFLFFHTSTLFSSHMYCSILSSSSIRPQRVSHFPCPSPGSDHPARADHTLSHRAPVKM